MSQDKTRYSEADLAEFKEVILAKFSQNIFAKISSSLKTSNFEIVTFLSFCLIISFFSEDRSE